MDKFAKIKGSQNKGFYSTSKIFFDKSLLTYFSTTTCIESHDITGCDTSQSQLNKFMLQVKELSSIQMLWLSGKSTSPRTAVWPTVHWISLWYQRHKPTLNRFFLVCAVVACSLKGAATECLSHWKCGCDWSWMWSWLVDWAGRHSICCILTLCT